MSQDDDRARLDALRTDVVRADTDLVSAIARRMAAAREIGTIKQRLGLPLMDPPREAEVVRRAAELARAHDVDPELVRALLWKVIDHARSVQSD
jgi:chorismate mutase